MLQVATMNCTDETITLYTSSHFYYLQLLKVKCLLVGVLIGFSLQ